MAFFALDVFEQLDVGDTRAAGLLEAGDVAAQALQGQFADDFATASRG